MALDRVRIAGILSLATGCAAVLGIAASQAAQAQATYETAPRDPQVIYDRTCGYCHGHNVGPIILGRNLPPQVVTFFVRNGNGAMPAFRPTEITDAELEALANWISTSDADAAEHGE